MATRHPKSLRRSSSSPAAAPRCMTCFPTAPTSSSTSGPPDCACLESRCRLTTSRYRVETNGGGSVSTSWDVIVVGGRLAGASTAHLLAKAGMRVLCVDRARFGSDTLSTHALMRAGVVQLQRWGLLSDIIAAGTPPVRRTVFHYGDADVSVSIRPAAGVDALYAPRRTLIDAVIAEAATAAGASVRFGTAVTGLLRAADGRVTGVTIRGRDGSMRAERAGLVIGADGRHSLVATTVGAETELQGHDASSFVYGYWADFPTDGYEWCYRPGMSAGAIPTNDGLTCVFVGAPPRRLARLVRSGGNQNAVNVLAGSFGA